MRKFVTLASLALLLCTASLQAQLVWQPPLGNPINFPDTELGQWSETALLVICMGGQWDIRMAIDNREFTVEPPAARLVPNAVAAFTIRFTPQAVGQRRGVMTTEVFSPDGIGMIARTNLSGVGIEGGEPEIQVVPREINLVVNEDQRSDFGEMRVSNVGDAALNVSIRFEPAAWLEIRGNLDFQVEPDDQWEVVIATTEEIPEDGDYQTTMTVNSNDPDNPRIFVPINLSVDWPRVGVQRIELARGWNMISTNRYFGEELQGDDGPDMRLIFEPILEQILLIKDYEGRFDCPEWDFWRLLVWDQHQGYLVKTSDPTALEITGMPIPRETEIELNAGWNLTAYFPDYPIADPFQAFPDINDFIILVKDGLGHFYAPAWQFSNLEFQPGQGYQFKMEQACVLVWPPEEEGAMLAGAPSQTHLDTPSHFPDPVNTGNNMQVLFHTITGIDVVEGAEIACLTPNGLVAGHTVITAEDEQWGMSVWGDDATTEEIDGFLTGEPLRFMYWDAEHNWELEVAYEVLEGADTFSVNGWLVAGVTVGVSNDEAVLPATIRLYPIYPNPFNSKAVVQFTLAAAGKYSLTLHDVEGRIVKSLSSGVAALGWHEAVISAENLPTGVYWAQLSTQGQSLRQKVVLIR